MMAGERPFTLGLHLRNMGPQSDRATILAAARSAETAGIDDLWVADHIAIPPDNAEGSEGRYVDPLATLAFVAGATRRIRLGTGVLVLPYRPPLATAKWVASIQELSGGRLLFGVGVGWMEAEFRAVGAPYARRAAITDETLAFIRRCFAADETEAHGQRFLFKPRPTPPPIIVGGAPPHALRRTVRYGDGWMPIGANADALRAPVAELTAMAADAGKPPPLVIAALTLPLDDPPRAADQAAALRAVGVTGLVHGWRYPDADAFARAAEQLVTHVRPGVAR
jgi:probable F420-dependent oxidoreductase